MILRRVIEHFRKQEWTAVGIDFVIVILGVFVGLQVNDWSAAQADKHRGRQYVERLVADLQSDLAGRRAGVAYYDAVNESAEQVNTLLRQASPDARSLVVNAYRATEYSYVPPTRATWDEIVSSGDLGLLPNAALKPLADYFSYDTALGVLDSLSVSPYRRRVRSTIPHEVQRAIREGCSDVRNPQGVITGFQTECALDVSAAELDGAALALRRDPAVTADLRYQFSDLNTARANLRGDVVLLESALAALRE